MAITVRRPVSITHIVTEPLKQRLLDELRQTADAVDTRVQQIDFQTKRYIAEVQKSDVKRAMAIKEQVQTELRRHEALRSDLQERIEEIEALQVDDEYEHGQVESEVTVKEGDSITDVLGPAAIIVKDDVVIEFRGFQA